MELFTAMILSCVVNAEIEALSCTTFVYPTFNTSMDECLFTLATGIKAVESSGAVAFDYRCIAWNKVGEDQPYNEKDI